MTDDARLIALAEQIADRWLTHGSFKWRLVREASLKCLRDAYSLGASSESEIRHEAGKSVARYADEQAVRYEQQAMAHRQVRTVPEPQLSRLKAQHWRILARSAREVAAGSQQEAG